MGSVSVSSCRCCMFVYICASSAVYLSSVFGGYNEIDMPMRGPPAEIASLHQHIECVYLGNPNIQYSPLL